MSIERTNDALSFVGCGRTWEEVNEGTGRKKSPVSFVETVLKRCVLSDVSASSINVGLIDEKGGGDRKLSWDVRT